MEGLLLDTPGSGIVTMEQAFNIPTPEATNTYSPVGNEDLWNMLSRIAAERGLELGIPQIGLANKGQRMFGSVEVLNHNQLDNEVRMMLGFRNSLDKTMSIGICFGSKVFVCSNMCFSGYASDGNDATGIVHQRHQSDVFGNLEHGLNESLNKFDIFKNYQEKLYNRLKEIRLRDAQAHDFIIKSARAGAINTTDCMKIANEWDFQITGPTNTVEEERWHPEFTPRTAWSLFNAFTEQAKAYQQKNPLKANLRSIKMNSLFHQQYMTN
jgi:hypothetical protein